MIPSQQIRALCFPSTKLTKPLLTPFDSTRLGSYYYNLSVECIISPGKRPTVTKLNDLSGPFHIRPGHIAWLRMREEVCTPGNIIASLEQTHQFTRMGLSFINLSLIFPNYSGYLTCAVANFSSSEISIFKGDNIARLTFFELEKSTYVSQIPKSFSSKDEYDAELIREATDGDDTFFGLAEIESKIKSSVMNELESFASRVLWRYGFVGGALIIFFTILPFLQGLFTETVYGDSIVRESDLREMLELMGSRLDSGEQGYGNGESED